MVTLPIQKAINTLRYHLENIAVYLEGKSVKLDLFLNTGENIHTQKLLHYILNKITLKVRLEFEKSVLVLCVNVWLYCTHLTKIHKIRIYLECLKLLSIFSPEI